MQDLWRAQIEWDSEAPDDILVRWLAWKDELNYLKEIQMPRWYGFHHPEVVHVQIHIFCDASELAYGAVAYFRVVTNVDIVVSFIFSKIRLAPIRSLTIPRLELQNSCKQLGSA